MKYIRGKIGQNIGYLNDIGGQIQAFHLRKGMVGWYNKGSDMTYDRTGKTFAYGDATVALIFIAELY